MKSKLRKKLLILILLVFPLLLTTSYHVTANENTNDYYNDESYEYVLSSYHINILVNENNTYNITEGIGAYFNISKHGIFRKIPLKNTVLRLDKTTSHNRAKVKKIKVDSPFSTYNEDGYKVIKIGSADTTFTGENNYTVNYVYDIGKDRGKNYDELYLNIIGTEWDTVISNITFTIIMPKSFDKSLLGFSSGKKGSTESSNISYQVNGRVITGEYIGSLNAGEAITVRLQLPEGYFVYERHTDIWSVFAILISLLSALFVFSMWKKIGKDGQVIETVEFYPPSGFNSAEVGFLFKGKAKLTDAMSLLIYLANQGYIKISESEDKSLFGKSKDFKLTKLKDYTGVNKSEKLFFDGLFKKKDEVTSKDLQDKFYVTLGKIFEEINSKKNKHKIFQKESLGKGFPIVLMIIIIFILITVKPVIENGDPELLVFALLFPGIGFSVFFGLVFGKTSVPMKIFGVLWGTLFGGVPWAIIVLPLLLLEPLFLVTYVIGLICILCMIICLKAMPSRTPYGNEMLGKIRGFKTFLETVEKPKLEAFVMEDPTYFYDILPYTYVLGVSDKWIKKFETISLQAPTWYDGNSTFNMVAFGSFMNSTMTSASSAMSSSPSSDSGGSGGGSSGGGSGGGGGGSW